MDVVPCSVAKIYLSKESFACNFRVEEKTYGSFSGTVVKFLEEKGSVSSQIKINFKDIFMSI
jgi:hypothetical protein